MINESPLEENCIFGDIVKMQALAKANNIEYDGWGTYSRNSNTANKQAETLNLLA